MTKREILTQLIAAEISYQGMPGMWSEIIDMKHYEALANKIIQITPKDKHVQYYSNGVQIDSD